MTHMTFRDEAVIIATLRAWFLVETIANYCDNQASIFILNYVVFHEADCSFTRDSSVLETLISNLHTSTSGFL